LTSAARPRAGRVRKQTISNVGFSAPTPVRPAGV
jgi:hypothetical protein